MTAPALVGCILAGGLARRMGGGDKPLLTLDGLPMLSHVIARLAPQVTAMVLNANGDPARFQAFGLPVAADPIEGFAGPLAGVLAGLNWARSHVPQDEGIVTVAGDTPFFPRDLVATLLKARGANPDTIVLARSGGHMHPVFGYWPLSCADDLDAFLTDGATRKVLAFVDRHPKCDRRVRRRPDGGDPFFNINTPEDLRAAEKTDALR
jgi:molybdopterin-guanine dinucleotide biosynthesis protein A